MSCRLQLRSATYLYVVCLCLWNICTTINALQHRGVVLLGQRDLKMGKKGKKHEKKQTHDDYYFDDITTNNSTSAPSDTLAPTPLTKSKKKKGKKGKKSKKKKKSKKGFESLSPSPSPANVTTVAPLAMATTTPVATKAPASTMAPAVVVIPTLNPGNVTTATSTPTVQSKAKKKKKSKKGGKGKGATEETFQLTGNQVTQAPIAPAPAPTRIRSKTATYKASSSNDASFSKAPSITTALTKPIAPSVNAMLTKPIAPSVNTVLTKPKAPSTKKAWTLSTTPSTKKISNTSKAPVVLGLKNTTNIDIEAVTTTPFPSPSLSPSLSPFPSLSVENELSSGSPRPSLLLETVDVSPFQLTYNIATSDKLSAEQINEAVDISFTYLNDFLIDTFDVNNRIKYDSLLGTRIAHSIDYTTVQYMAAARFVIPDSDSTTYLPATNDIDVLIEMAFNPESAETMLDLLRKLPSSNPYSRTTAVAYALITVETPSAAALDTPPQNDNGKTVAARVGISGAVLIICLFTGLVALYRWGYFKKVRRKRNKTQYHKAATSASRSHSVQKDANHKEDDNDSVNDESDDEDVSMSDCTSSVRSCPTSSSGIHNDEESYRRRILEEDVEIKFLYPKNDGNMDCDVSIDDPLFPSSPLISQDSDAGKKRHNI